MSDKELQEEFLKFLAEKSKAKTLKDLEKYVKSLGEDGLKKAYEEFTTTMLKKTLKAAHGAKLQYVKSLKRQCAEDEELVYFKRGGSLDCGCVKKKAPKVTKKCGGGFMKKSKIIVSAKGSKVCPKCGKVHTGACK